MRRLFNILRQYREDALKLAEENITLLQKGYADGLVTITAVIQAQQQFIELRLNYLDTLAEFQRALTDWQAATASIPLNRTEK
jgi:outer membrane protein TolC